MRSDVEGHEVRLRDSPLISPVRRPRMTSVSWSRPDHDPCRCTAGGLKSNSESLNVPADYFNVE